MQLYQDPPRNALVPPTGRPLSPSATPRLNIAFKPALLLHPGGVATLGALLLSLLAADATGPNNQLVPNPAPGGANTLSSVVALLNVGGGIIQSGGSGTVIDSVINAGDNNGYLCVLTADHVELGSGTPANVISFANTQPVGGAAPGAGTYSIIGAQQVAGFAGQNVDLDVVLVRYGAPDAFFNAVPDKSLTTSVGVGNTLSEVGFGLTATPNFSGANLISLTQQNGTYGTKRYQNNALTAFVANSVHGAYKENDVTYTFDAQGTANYVAGEGFGFSGDSGAPLFNNTSTFNPGGGLPLVAATDSIAGVDVFGPTGTITNSQAELTVDVFDYRNNINTACANLMTLIPEPSSCSLFVAGACTLLARRRFLRRQHLQLHTSYA